MTVTRLLAGRRRGRGSPRARRLGSQATAAGAGTTESESASLSDPYDQARIMIVTVGPGPELAGPDSEPAIHS